jgi:hypothetical protein
MIRGKNKRKGALAVMRLGNHEDRPGVPRYPPHRFYMSKHNRLVSAVLTQANSEAAGNYGTFRMAEK